MFKQWFCNHIYGAKELIVDEYEKEGIPRPFFRQVYKRTCVLCNHEKVFESRNTGDKRLTPSGELITEQQLIPPGDE